ncbi:putative transmembrane protein [Rhizoctonia solani 123E]|uniref:Putative transmembrane protein n=1 Tax=Rhizoctonia solani 123E TaxID=1423351 RepID=A0A074S5S4_9AGAM|nr:putative transmembrane protein [Rhizoctonia solani 123E]
MRVSKLCTCLSAGSLAFAFGSVIFGGPIQGPLPAASQPSLSQSNGKPPWDAPPAGDSYDNQIFFRLATLLQHWPNTRYPSGASIVPGTIPIGTTLYHGRSSTELPPRPDWLAFDPEHSALFTRGPSGRLFTFVTTRSLRVLYFDGSSAAKLSSGAADTQDLLAWGHIGNETFGDEQALINDLCKWGKPLGIDGYVRMEMSFEVMYCDFYQGIEVVSSLHILPPEESHMPGPPGNGPGGPPPSKELNLPDRSSAMKQRSLEAFQAGAWHRRAPGEVRVRLDVARLVSLYDPALRSGMKTRKGLEKIQHRGKGLSQEDIETFRTWVIDSVQPTAPATSGVDWQALTTVIMDRYSSRLEYLQLLLKPDHISANATAVVQDVRTELMIMLMPDLTSDTVPRSATRTTSSAAAHYSQLRRGEARTDEWIKPILDHCSSYLVSHLPQDKFTREERTLYAGVSGTLHEICRVLSLLWSEAYDPLPTTPPVILIGRWRVQVDELIQWLDWPMWNKCTPECDLDSICFIPTWPRGIGRGPGGKGEEDLTKVDWTPKCLHKKDESW